MLSTVILIAGAAIVAGGLGLWVYGERGHLLMRSSRLFLRQAGIRNFMNGNALHAYVYGRWIKEYIRLLIGCIGPRLSPAGKTWLANHYHAKVLTPDQAKAIITIDKEIPLQDLEQVIPYSTARELVLKGPPDVAVFQCGCRQNRDKPCEPTQVCMVIGQPFADFVLEHHPDSSRRLTQEQALELLRAEHERGHLHSAWFKDAMLNRFYAICNCCKCCCAGIEAMVKRGVRMMSSSGYVAQVDESLCAGCPTCETACPFGSIRVNGSAAVTWETCMGCGVCTGKCPLQAISLVRDERKGLPLDVRLLSREPRLQ
jgi:ferredoxin